MKGLEFSNLRTKWQVYSLLQHKVWNGEGHWDLGSSVQVGLLVDIASLVPHPIFTLNRYPALWPLPTH